MANNETAPSKSKKIKIISLVIGIIVIILAGAGIYLNAAKPSASQLLSTSAKTSIKSARSVIKIDAEKEDVTQNIEFNDDINHMAIKSKPANSQDQDLWSSSERVYTKLKNKWYYVNISNNQIYQMFFSTMFTSSKKLFTEHNYSKFNKNALKEFKVKLDGLNGYYISYNGNDSDVIKGLLKASRLTKSQANSLVNQIQKVSFTIKTDRKQKLRDLQYTLTYKDGRGSITFHLSDINNAKDLKIPEKVTKNAKETSIDKLQK